MVTEDIDEDRAMPAIQCVWEWPARPQPTDPCVCTHTRDIHMQDGGCRACSCDVPAAVILAFAA